VRYRALGRTGLRVSALSLGTASLGVEYGIAAPGEFGRPDEETSVRLVRAALDRGVTLFDTAPAYGNAERIVGRAIGRDPRAIIATKTLPCSHVVSGFGGTVISSVERSLREIDREVIDILQLPNASREMVEHPEVTRALVEAKKRGLVRFLGATVYQEDAALAIVKTGEFDTLQVAVSLLDQRKLRSVLPAASAAGVAVIARSALLKGALTPKAQWLPAELAPLRDATVRARDTLANGSWDRLPRAAMRYCLTVPRIASVLAGARTLAELDAAIEAEAAGPLGSLEVALATELAIDDERLLNPSHWPVA
jgi:aryl-alcohol dehydrogenase-like predicted oxidoreductase